MHSHVGTDLNGVRRRAVARVRGTAHRVRHMALVVRAVEVLAIPAAAENHLGPHTIGARLLRERGLWASVVAWVIVAQADCGQYQSVAPGAPHEYANQS
jgi:hypothetical protein